MGTSGSVSKLKRTLQAALLTLLLGQLGTATQAPPPVQSGDKAAAEFPGTLLEGMPAFSFALQFQSDARGNFGPCG